MFSLTVLFATAAVGQETAPKPTSEEAQRATALVAEKLPAEERPQLHLFAMSSKAQSASAVLGQIQDDIVSKGGRQ